MVVDSDELSNIFAHWRHQTLITLIDDYMWQNHRNSLSQSTTSSHDIYHFVMALIGTDATRLLQIKPKKKTTLVKRIKVADVVAQQTSHGKHHDLVWLLIWHANFSELYCMSRTTHEPVIVVYFCVGWMADGLVNKHQTDDPTYRGDQGTANKDGRPDLGCEICWQVSDSWAYATTAKAKRVKLGSFSTDST